MNRKKYSEQVSFARNKYSAHKSSAKQRGIPFLLTFEQWWQIWQESGHWEKRGHPYMMTRLRDEGPYAVENVRIATGAQNAEDRQRVWYLKGYQASSADPPPVETRTEYMRHKLGRIQRQMLQILRSCSVAVDTAALARRVYLTRELMPAQRVASWRALDGLEQRGLVIRRSRRGQCYWCTKR
jgi:hypothetical protein